MFAHSSVRAFDAAVRRNEERARQLAFLLATRQGKFVVLHLEKNTASGWVHSVEETALLVHLDVRRLIRAETGELAASLSVPVPTDLRQVDLTEVAHMEVYTEEPKDEETDVADWE